MIRLFDKETGFLRLDEIVVESESYQKIMADNIVTDDEVAEQAELVIGLFKEIDAKLKEDDKSLVVKAVSELAVLYEINAKREGV